MICSDLPPPGKGRGGWGGWLAGPAGDGGGFVMVTDQFIDATLDHLSGGGVVTDFEIIDGGDSRDEEQDAANIAHGRISEEPIPSGNRDDTSDATTQVVAIGDILQLGELRVGGDQFRQAESEIEQLLASDNILVPLRGVGKIGSHPGTIDGSGVIDTEPAMVEEPHPLGQMIKDPGGHRGVGSEGGNGWGDHDDFLSCRVAAMVGC